MKEWSSSLPTLALNELCFDNRLYWKQGWLGLVFTIKMVYHLHEFASWVSCRRFISGNSKLPLGKGINRTTSLFFPTHRPNIETFAIFTAKWRALSEEIREETWVLISGENWRKADPRMVGAFHGIFDLKLLWFFGQIFFFRNAPLLRVQGGARNAGWSKAVI